MRNFVFIIIILLSKICFSQNLVPNPSFEDYTSCPDASSQLFYAIPWIAKDNNSVEYFNSCSSTRGVPNHGSSFQYAKTGQAYAGFWAYNGINNNYREYLQVQLNSILSVNNCYLITFYVNTDIGNYAVNSIGGYISNIAIGSTTGSGSILNYEPQILKFMNPILKDSANWIEISSIYYSTGDENYLTIGNFYNDASTDTLSTGYSTYEGAYYNIDDVSVIAIDDLPGGMLAFAGNDATISQLGDSAFIGQEISNLNCNWSILGGSQIASNTSGLFVQPTTTTTYVVEQTLCGTITYDTVTVFVTVGMEELDHQSIFEIYPNPTTGKVFVSSQGIEEGNLKVIVMDITGKEVFNSILSIQNGVTDFDLKVESGTYIISIINSITNDKVIQKIAIQK